MMPWRTSFVRSHGPLLLPRRLGWAKTRKEANDNTVNYLRSKTLVEERVFYDQFNCFLEQNIPAQAFPHQKVNATHLIKWRQAVETPPAHILNKSFLT